jgi:fucose 4-O-acetylase-like acetyltransferase
VNIGFRPGLETWWPGGLFGVPFFSLVVPVFFALSGYVAALQPPGPEARPWPWLRRRLSRLLPPFFVWNAILLATGVPERGLPAPEILFFFLLGAGPLYYVGALVQLLTLFALLDTSAGGKRLLLAGSFALSAAFYVAADLATWSAVAGAEIFETHLNRFFPAWGVFFAKGVLLGRSEGVFLTIEKRRVGLIVVAAVSFAAFVGELQVAEARFGFHPIRQFFITGLPLQIAGTLLILAGLRRLDLSERARTLLARLAAAGPDTFGIYLSHVSAQAGLFALWVAAGHDTAEWWEVPLLAIASWAVCQGSVRIARRLPIPAVGTLLFGVVPQSQIRRPNPGEYHGGHEAEGYAAPEAASELTKKA